MVSIAIPVYWTSFLEDPSTTVLRMGAQQRDMMQKIYQKQKEVESLKLKFQQQEVDLLRLVEAAYDEKEIDQANAEYCKLIKPLRLPVPCTKLP
jgi:hypothetical protein